MVFIPVQDDNPLRHIRFQWVTIAIIILDIMHNKFKEVQTELEALGSVVTCYKCDLSS